MQERFELAVISDERMFQKFDLAKDGDMYSSKATKVLFIGFCMGANWLLETIKVEGA